MIDILDARVFNEAGEGVSVAGELLCFVEHAFTPAAERAARLASRVLASGTACRLVSVDSSAALAAWVAGLGLAVPVGSDPEGTLLAVLLAYALGSAGSGSAGGEAVPTGAPRAPPRTAAALAGDADAGGGAASPAAAPGERKGGVGGGWYAVPPTLAGDRVRFADGVLEVLGGSVDRPPMACLGTEPDLRAAVALSGEWSLDEVGNKDSKGARVAVRLLNAGGTMVEAESVAGGAQIFVVQGRRSLEWTPFSTRVEPHPAVTAVRLCVDNRAGAGVVRVRNVVFGAQ